MIDRVCAIDTTFITVAYPFLLHVVSWSVVYPVVNKLLRVPCVVVQLL